MEVSTDTKPNTGVTSLRVCRSSQILKISSMQFSLKELDSVSRFYVAILRGLFYNMATCQHIMSYITVDDISSHLINKLRI